MSPVSKKHLFLVSNLVFVLPITASVAQVLTMVRPLRFVLYAKWFLFFAVGVRLFFAGLNQTLDPGFTSAEIFGRKTHETYPIVRALGIATLCIGLIAITALFLPQWRMVSAIISGVYFLLITVPHLSGRPADVKEIFTLVTDILSLAVLVAYVIFL